MDLFVSRHIAQIDKFVSLIHDPEAKSIDAYILMIWTNFEPYIFTSFSRIGRVLNKISAEKYRKLYWLCHCDLFKTGFLYWFQLWLIIPLVYQDTQISIHANTMECHPLSRKLVLVACAESGNHLKIQDYQDSTYLYYCRHGCQ